MGAHQNQIVIAGGGIAGIAAALALARAGRIAIVCERAAAFAEAGAGVQLGPNAVRALKALGAWDAVAPHCFAPAAIIIRDGLSGRVLKRVGLGAGFAQRFGEAYRVIHRADLLSGLMAAARANPAIDLRMAAEVTGFSPHDDHIRVELQSGPPLHAAGLIGADGVGSLIRRKLTGELPAVSGDTIFRSLIPMPVGVDADAVTLWLCPGAHVVQYPVRAGRMLNLVVSVAGDVEQASPLHRLNRGHADLLYVLAPVQEWSRWIAYDLETLAQWSRGPVLLIGDAAHAALPYLAQGAAMALEDAAALGPAIAAAPTLQDAFARFETLRKPRTARMAAAARAQGRIYHAGGLMRLARNGVLQAMPQAVFLQRLAWIYRGQ